MSNSCSTYNFASCFFPLVIYLKAFLSVDRLHPPVCGSCMAFPWGDQRSVSFLLHPFVLLLTERCYKQCLFYAEFSHVSSYLGEYDKKKKKGNCGMKCFVFFWPLLWIFFVYPEGLGHVKVSLANRASQPLSLALTGGHHLSTNRQKSSWLYLCFLNCYGACILFSVFINQISSCGIISSFPWHICFVFAVCYMRAWHQ